MSYFAFNLLLAIFWVFMTGNFSLLGFVAGFVIGFVGLWFGRHVIGSGQYTRNMVGVFRLVSVFLYELVVANVHLAQDILRREPRFQPGFLAFDVRDLPPLETVMLGNMISLTPGTLTVDASEDGGMLYIHTVYAQDPERARRGFRKFADLIHGAVGTDDGARTTGGI
jgi:multicomponent Na+:H+ antiporter subunit E